MCILISFKNGVLERSQIGLLFVTAKHPPGKQFGDIEVVI